MSHDFVTVTVTMSSDVTDVWQCGIITLTLTLGLQKRKINPKKKEKEIK